jgi:hypothetical protein
MLKVVHTLASWFLKRRIEHIGQFSDHPHETQARVFRNLIERGRETAWGRAHGFADLRSPEQFRQQIPVSTYEQLFPWIERAIQGEADVLWPGRVSWFAKSSGTTNDRSKYIPVTADALEFCHYSAGQDMLSVYLHNQPDSKLFTGKSLSIGGSHAPSPFNSQARVGDVSAVILENLPPFFEMVRAPRKEVALIPSWEDKLGAMAREVDHENITALVGVPTWTIALIRHLIETRRLSSILDLWPNLELYVHGGVSFEPYRNQFQSVIPSRSMRYLDCYNASEGFFAFQAGAEDRDMLLLLDYGIYYEFIPVEALDEAQPRACELGEVELGRNYALLISTNAGLWRYLIGDTVMFTSLRPYKIRVTGRTKQYINVFGEELMVDNAEQAITAAAAATHAEIVNYTAGPIFPESGAHGGHEWLIEFSVMPDSLESFGQQLDAVLKSLNSDYEAKRAGGLAIGAPLIRALPEGTFYQWMKQRGKLGGQHKVPRLSNERRYIEEILALLATQA